MKKKLLVLCCNLFVLVRKPIQGSRFEIKLAELFLLKVRMKVVAKHF
jgi:hypothetical protein